MKAVLHLEDGTCFEGEAFGATGQVVGEVVLQTSMSGLEEILADPTYCDQIVLMTYPLVGNGGLSRQKMEGRAPALRALIVSEPDWIAEDAERISLDAWLRAHGVVGLYGMDTRKLARHLRDRGMMKGVLVSGQDSLSEEAVRSLLAAPQATDQVRRVSAREVLMWKTDKPRAGWRPTVVLMDFGVKRSFRELLLRSGCDVIQVPYDTDFSAISAYSPDGVFLSNGPGDPHSLAQVLPTISALVKKYPLFAVGLGHQLFALACGAKVAKMPLGHRGTNYPVQEVQTGKGWITAQHHGYDVLESSLEGTRLEVTYRLLHDGSVEGLRHRDYPAFSVQFHPDAHPGPTDTLFLFEQFVQLMANHRGGNA